ncbi:MAG TPA: hypothetical protein EYQ27_19335 [Gemmatimonadetes bacterium]|nr:hypothetical protein [Gemmatimonadota bacterium]
MKRLGVVLRDRRAALLLVTVLAAVVYTNTLWNGFAYDDFHIIANNEAIQSLETLPGAVFSPYWPGVYGRENGLWRPISQLLYGLQWFVADGSPWLFHLTNLVGHALVTALVLLLLAELMSLPGALVGALVFAVHPLHVEVVANVVGMGEIVSTAFFLTACLLHIRGPTESSWGRSVAIGLLYALAFGAKEGAVTLPGIIFLLDAARTDLSVRDVPRYLAERWRVYLALVVAAAALLIMRWQIVGSIADPLGPLGADLLAEVPRIWTISEVWGNYVRLWILPVDLSSDYSPNVIPVSVGWNLSNGVGLALALGILALALTAWRRGVMATGQASSRVAGFGVVWFLITMSPVLNVFFVVGVLLAERTLYLPSVGLAAATGWMMVRLSRDRPRVAAISLLVMLTLAGVRTWTRSPTWASNDAMLNAMVADYPHSGRSQWVLGDALMDIGQTSQALLSYRAAIDLLDSHYQITTDVAQTMMKKELFRGAEGLLLHAWRREPRFALAPGLLAEIYSIWGQPEEAERLSRVALAIDDRDPLRPHIISWSLVSRGRFEDALEVREAALDVYGLQNYWQQWVTLAYLSAHEEDSATAVMAFDAAMAVDLSAVEHALLDSLRVEVLGPPPADTVSGGGAAGGA